ncbi:MAG: rhodanese-like domain-containing protein [Bacteroidales bacterium]|nr:rhodanese-like domain-containing protein [Bacteroidales bacterium]
MQTEKIIFTVENISAEMLKQEMIFDNCILLDVRTKVEYISEHIPGALNIDIYDVQFSDKVLQLEKNTKIFVYCRTGHRSALAANYLKKKGYDAVYNLQKGILDWKKKGFDLKIHDNSL